MGWENSHLHFFYNGKNYFAPKEFEIEDSKNSRTTKLKTILNKKNSIILYEYDFGDSWVHQIILEKILSEDTEQIPRCIEGSRNSPPEDCGGTFGYEELLTTISNPQHEDYESMMEWVGEDFDPDYFNIKEINKRLKRKDYGCIWIE